MEIPVTDSPSQRNRNITHNFFVIKIVPYNKVRHRQPFETVEINEQIQLKARHSCYSL